MQARTALIAFLFILALPVALAADFPGALKVTFRTSDCDGATGLGSVNVDHITRIQPYACPNGQKRKQVLTHTPGGTNEAFTISDDESLKLEAQIQHIMDARQKALQDGKQVIIKH
jgi:hypothetical protein